MASRHRSRERALQMIFQWEASQDAPEEVVRSYWSGLSAEIDEAPPQEDDFSNSLVLGVTRRVRLLDDMIQRHTANWRLERMAAVDRNILRLAVFEMQQGETAPPVVINEALELGRRFSGEQSSRFLNGVLDAVRKTLDRPLGDPPTESSPNSPPAGRS